MKSFFSRALLFTALLLVVDATKFLIETEFKPENCDSSKKSENGDKLSMHYTGRVN
jgi:hypothetical protein